MFCHFVHKFEAHLHKIQNLNFEMIKMAMTALLEMSHADYLMDIVPMRIIWHIQMQGPSDCNKRYQVD